ncbi:hypothetical protein COU58_04665 [Candidatus Pacearchaeota archaeon CG10_big_fil_rev_8_21_14_0_10_32_42]|nr:MAG: hypothetical protein COU58_04665 [Candidatus Pacearchaeota archaeon CG10_big_fil_rev_8_21_14_0_10_32_42]
MRKSKKMNKKNLAVTLCALTLALFLVSTVSAGEITTNYQVTVEGILVLVSSNSNLVSALSNSNVTAPSQNAAVVAGEDFTLRVYFTSNVYDTDVVLKATLEGEKVEFDARTSVFDVETSSVYRKVLVMEVPYELKDRISDELTLSIEIDGKNHKTTIPDITLKVQRPSYNVDVKSITTPSTITAGEDFPLEIVLKNIGYNDLDDVYVSVGISELGIIQGPKWFGDIVSIATCNSNCEEEDTVIGELSLRVPYNVEPGIYELEVLVQNDDLRIVKKKQIVISNDFLNNIMITTMSQTVAPGEEASYNLLIVNPTDNVKVYRIVTDGDVLSASQSVVAVPSGSSTTVDIKGSSDKAGKYTFNVYVFDGDTLVKTVPLELNVEGNSSNTIVILTIVLAIIFLVLLVVLIVLLSRKPEKTSEDFGESYY